MSHTYGGKIMDENNNYLNDAENTEGIDASIAESADNKDIVSEAEDSIESNIDSTEVEEPVDYEPLQIYPEKSQFAVSNVPQPPSYVRHKLPSSRLWYKDAFRDIRSRERWNYAEQIRS